MQNEPEKVIAEYIGRTPKSIRELLASDIWTNDIDVIVQKLVLTENKINILKNEVLFVLVGLEHRNNFEENVRRELELDYNTAKTISEEVERKIFNKITNELNSLWQNTENVDEQAKGSGVGNDFEQIILNQAKAMQPAVPAGGRIMNNESRIMDKKEDVQSGEPRMTVPNYSSGNDPYREPTV